MRVGYPLLSAMAVALLLPGCSEPPPLYVDGGYVRLNANPQAPSAAYFTIHGGGEAVVLRGVTTAEAVRLEVHESMMAGGMASMKPIQTIDIPARTAVKLEPGGKHIMLWNVNQGAVANGKMTFTFIFSNGDRIIADATIQKANAATAPSGHEGMAGMNGMDGNHSH